MRALDFVSSGMYTKPICYNSYYLQSKWLMTVYAAQRSLNVFDRTWNAKAFTLQISLRDTS